MKTNKKNILATAILWVSTMVSFGLFCDANAAAVIPASSGVQTQYYKLEWCSPHWERLQGGWTSSCRTGYFQNVGWVAKIVYDGKDYPLSGVEANTPVPSASTSTSDTAWAVSKVLSLFTGVTDGAFSLEGEGVVRITVVLMDYAENATRYEITYKIDKTAPQLALNGLDGSNAYTYYGGRVGVSQVVNKNDSVNDTSNADTYNNPTINLYTGDNAISRPTHTRNNLHAFYFQNTVSGVGANSPFTANVKYSDDYQYSLSGATFTYLLGGANFSDGKAPGSLVSGENKFQLLTSDSIPQADIPLSNTLAMSTKDLVNNGVNSQQKYRLRLYDNTVGPSGVVDSGNYSETAFYAVRDNSAPNLGGNGLAMDSNTAIEAVLKFPDNDTVYDKTTGWYNPTTSGYSRFFAADSAQSMNYMINDTGITGQWTNTGTGCTDYKLCNAGINTTDTQINIQTATAPIMQSLYYQPTDRFINQGTRSYDFSRSDNGNLASNETYRYYDTQFLTNGISQLCDLVGNCITPQLKFRVVANVLSNTQSNVSLATESDSSGKMMANGSDAYKFTYALRDTYGNKVIPVYSTENNVAIKSVSTQTRFLNGLAVDQRTNTPTGVKLVSAADKETDNLTVDLSAINASGALLMQEDVNKKPNGNFAVTLASKVPSTGFYPYLSSASALKLQSIDNTAEGTAPSDISYPKTGASRLGYFSAQATAGSTNGLVVPNTGNLGETGGFSNISVDENLYGTYSYVNANNVAFDAMTSRSVNLEYASPYLYGLIGFKTLIDGQYMQHYKKLFTISTSGGVNTPTIYERNLVAYNTDKDEQPGVLNFDVRQVGSTVNTLYNEGIGFPAATSAFFSGALVSKNLNIQGATGTGLSVEVQMSAIPGHAPYDRSKLRTAFVSGLTYRVGGDTVMLPSVARNIKDASATSLDQFAMARNYYSNTYSIGAVPPQLQASMITDIAVTGLTNRYNAITTDVGGSKANANVTAEISRPNMIATIKKNVAIQSAGFAPVGSPAGTKQWCSGTTINQSFINTGSPDCTITINGEEISFINWDSTLDCGASDCRVTKKRSIIIQNGHLHIKSNITTLDGANAQTDGQFFLGVMNAGGLDNLAIDGTSPDISNSNKKGWMFVDPSITNLDAFLLAQGPVVSYDGSKFFTTSLTTENQLRNQLHIMGSLLSLNNIGASRKVTPECPYIVGNCNAETAQMFDLVYLRRYTLGSKMQFTDDPLDSSIFTPYHPDGVGIARKSGGLPGDEPTDPALCSGKPGLRCIKDADYRAYPMLIERDTRWNSAPSIFFQSN